jgi:hypothetical protein
MRDTRKQRAILVVALSAAIGAVLGDYFIKPALEDSIKKGKR